MKKTLVLGAGKFQRIQGAEHQDVRPFPGIDLVFDLDGHWPVSANVYDELIATHVVEHLKDLVRFMDQAWDILSPGGCLYIETPLAGGDVDLEFADPTHVRCYRKHTFINYFTKLGIHNFGYTDKAWALWHVEEKNNCLIVHASPIK